MFMVMDALQCFHRSEDRCLDLLSSANENVAESQSLGERLCSRVSFQHARIRNCDVRQTRTIESTMTISARQRRRTFTHILLCQVKIGVMQITTFLSQSKAKKVDDVMSNLNTSRRCQADRVSLYADRNTVDTVQCSNHFRA
ncbi:hypothetical protein Mapa_008981 [Marchantia paleacea]|nr:hypothetical protein Mapa_008981 [Marchantia paleacea]